jgi:hypothetical protein
MNIPQPPDEHRPVKTTGDTMPVRVAIILSNGDIYEWGVPYMTLTTDRHPGKPVNIKPGLVGLDGRRVSSGNNNEQDAIIIPLPPGDARLQLVGALVREHGETNIGATTEKAQA